MAATLAGARLTEAHRLAQARIGAQTVKDVFTTFPLLDPTDLDATTVAWLRTVVPIIQLRRASSARLAGTYLNTFRSLEHGGHFAPILSPEAPIAQVVTSLTVTGPVALKRAIARGVDLARATETAQVTAARSGMRLAMAGGRQTLIDTVKADPDSGRFQRVTSGSPCEFCSMLEGRGAVYLSAESAGEDEPYHDGCNCSIEPGY